MVEQARGSPHHHRVRCGPGQHMEVSVLVLPQRRRWVWVLQLSGIFVSPRMFCGFQKYCFFLCEVGVMIKT